MDEVESLEEVVDDFLAFLFIRHRSVGDGAKFSFVFLLEFEDKLCVLGEETATETGEDGGMLTVGEADDLHPDRRGAAVKAGFSL